jgi:putative oxidoreductase
MALSQQRQQQLTDIGLLCLRLGMGAMFIVHGAPKMAGGPDKWTSLGSAMQHIGVDVYPEIFGFLASFAEFFGGIALILGLMTRPAAFMMLCTMVVAATMHLRTGDGVSGAAHAIEAGVTFLGLLLLGGGRFSLDRRLGR